MHAVWTRNKMTDVANLNKGGSLHTVCGQSVHILTTES